MRVRQAAGRNADSDIDQVRVMFFFSYHIINILFLLVITQFKKYVLRNQLLFVKLFGLIYFLQPLSNILSTVSFYKYL